MSKERLPLIHIHYLRPPDREQIYTQYLISEEGGVKVTGTYANILTPCVFEEGGIWRTTDLFLDLWIDSTGHLLKLDEDELGEAERKGWVDPDTARRAREEVRM